MSIPGYKLRQGSVACELHVAPGTQGKRLAVNTHVPGYLFQYFVDNILTLLRFT